MSPAKAFWYILSACCVILTATIAGRILTEPRGRWEDRGDGTLFNSTTGEVRASGRRYSRDNPFAPQADSASGARIRRNVLKMRAQHAPDADVKRYLQQEEGVDTTSNYAQYLLMLTPDDGEFQVWRRAHAGGQ